MFPCLRTFFSDISLSSKFGTLIIRACRTQTAGFLFRINFTNDHDGGGGDLFIEVSRLETAQYQKCFSFCRIKETFSGLPPNNCSISQIVLLQNFGDYVERLWDKLPEYVKADSEVQQYRSCMRHYNQPWQRTHIDGPPPLIKDCYVWQRELCEAAVS